MRNFIIIGLGLIWCLGIGGCCEEEASPLNSSIYIGSFELLESSLAKIPYQDSDGVVFTDSAGNEMVFEIMVYPTLHVDSAVIIKHDVYITGDTVRYIYSGQFMNTTLINEENTIRFSCSLRTNPYDTDLESGFVADIYQVHIYDPDNFFNGGRVFYDHVNQRTYPNQAEVIVFQNFLILGKVFHDVRMNNYTYPKSVVMFNYEYGIVSFTDHEDKLWRFDRFE